MPLNRPALTLGASPRAAADARRWVAQLCRDIDREELVECAELGVSELVANAVLHGEPPVRVRVRGTANHPRIEVLDASLQPPVPVAHDPVEVEEALLSTLGRGLSIVAKASVAWGAAIEQDRKVVWFEPAPDIAAEAVDGVIDTVGAEQVASRRSGSVQVVLRGIELSLLATVETHYQELRRELRLLSLAHQEDYPLARELSAAFTEFEKHFAPEASLAALRARAVAEGADTVDLTVPLSPDAGPVLTTMLGVLDLADAFCQTERLLSLHRTPLQREFHVWLFGECVRQLTDGGSPRPWPGRDRGRASSTPDQP